MRSTNFQRRIKDLVRNNWKILGSMLWIFGLLILIQGVCYPIGNRECIANFTLLILGLILFGAGTYIVLANWETQGGSPQNQTDLTNTLILILTLAFISVSIAESTWFRGSQFGPKLPGIEVITINRLAMIFGVTLVFAAILLYMKGHGWEKSLKDSFALISLFVVTIVLAIVVAIIVHEIREDPSANVDYSCNVSIRNCYCDVSMNHCTCDRNEQKCVCNASKGDCFCDIRMRNCSEKKEKNSF